MCAGRWVGMGWGWWGCGVAAGWLDLTCAARVIAHGEGVLVARTVAAPAVVVVGARAIMSGGSPGDGCGGRHTTNHQVAAVVVCGCHA